MKPDDFDLISRLVKERSGLVITKDKVYLLESRLMPVARKHKHKTLGELVHAVRTRGDKTVIDDVVDAMTTNESLFFRDMKPFDQFRQVILPHLLANRTSNRTIRIWSAACSSGQEPYSLAILLKEEGAKLAGWKFDIVATDISQEMIARATSGIFSQFEVQRGMPVKLLVKYFKQQGDKWQIDPSIKQMINFRYFNLLESPQPLGRFDVVFCRNVLIYFDNETKKKVLNGIVNLLPADGILYLGGAETVLGVTDKFEPVPELRGIYRPVGGTMGAGSNKTAAAEVKKDKVQIPGQASMFGRASKIPGSPTTKNVTASAGSIAKGAGAPAPASQPAKPFRAATRPTSGSGLRRKSGLRPLPRPGISRPKS